MSAKQIDSLETVVAGVKEALDSGDLKRAFRLCTGALASDNHPYLLALKAVILLKLNRRLDSYKAAVEAQTHIASTQSTAFDLLITVFKDLRKYNNVAQLYERAYEE